MSVDFNQSVIAEFRANHGRVGGMFEGAQLILLTTTGARSGRSHTTPLGFLHDEGERLLVIGSAGGGPRHPDWYYNLRKHPRVTVETGVRAFDADAVVLTGSERDRIFAKAAADEPDWAEYERRAGRRLPVVALHPVSGRPSAG